MVRFAALSLLVGLGRTSASSSFAAHVRLCGESSSSDCTDRTYNLPVHEYSPTCDTLGDILQGDSGWSVQSFFAWIDTGTSQEAIERPRHHVREHVLWRNPLRVEHFLARNFLGNDESGRWGSWVVLRNSQHGALVAHHGCWPDCSSRRQNRCAARDVASRQQGFPVGTHRRVHVRPSGQR